LQNQLQLLLQQHLVNPSIETFKDLEEGIEDQ
jgi:hypothetical protein